MSWVVSGMADLLAVQMLHASGHNEVSQGYNVHVANAYIMSSAARWKQLPAAAV